MKFCKLVMTSLFVAVLFVDTACAGYSDPTLFWKRFRQAVLDNDMKTIDSLTKFPFKTRGTLDSNPIIKHDRKRFKLIYFKLISEEEELVSPEGRLVSKTMLQLIKEKTSLGPKDFNTPTCLWIHDFVFERINGSWFFTFAYLDD